MVKIYLCTEDLTTTILLPVTPPEINVAEGTAVRRYETANAGNISLIGFAELVTVSFSSIFPEHPIRASVDRTGGALDYVDQIERLSARRVPVRLIMTGLNFDRSMILEKFEYQAAQGDSIRYSISLTEKR